MRCSLLAIAVLLLATVAAAEETRLAVAKDAELAVAKDAELAVAKDAELLPALRPVNDKLQKARQGLDAVQKFINIFTADIFKGTKVGIVAEILSKTLSFVIAFMDLFGGKQESAEMRYMRIQFAETHARLNSIELQLGDIKQLIDWTTTRSMYAGLERHIVTASRNFDKYMETRDDFWKRQFLDHFRSHQQAAYELYHAIVETNQVIGSNLATAVVHFSKNHKRKVMSFLMVMNRLILRGAQLQVAYEGMVDSEAAAMQKEAVWQSRMTRLAQRLKDVDSQVERVWHAQMNTDMRGVVNENRGLHNREFVGSVYNFLVDKFHWLHWFVLAYQNVGGFNNHAVSHCGSFIQFRAPGDRNVVVASSDKEFTRFSRAHALNVLAGVDGSVRDQHAGNFLNAINARLNNNACNAAALRAAVCWGCNVWYTNTNRVAYRRMTAQRGGSMNTFMFG